jgi:hypothetical protein
VARRPTAADVASALERALEGDMDAQREADRALRGKLPAGIPPTLVERYWAERMSFPRVYFRLRWVTDAYAEATVAGLRRWDDPVATFLVSAIAAPTADEVRAANEAFRRLHPTTPFTPKGRASYAAVMASPAYAHATRTTVRKHGWDLHARQFMLALVYDGSAASVAALRGSADATRAAGGAAWTDLTRYERFAGSPAMKALLAPR